MPSDHDSIMKMFLCERRGRYNQAMDSLFLILGISAILSLLPAAILPWRQGAAASGSLFWACAMVALAGPLAVVGVTFDAGWQAGFSGSLWATIAVSAGAFLLVAFIHEEARKLAALLMPYLILLGTTALIASGQGQDAYSAEAPAGWIWLHIIFSLATYATLTLTAIAGLSAFIQERALKTKKRSALVTILPSLASSDALETSLLRISGVVLVIGFMSGMTVQYFIDGTVLELDHKTIFVSAALLVVIGLILARRFSGVRGRQAARYVMGAWLLITLAYPGVKLVSEIIGP